MWWKWCKWFQKNMLHTQWNDEMYNGMMVWFREVWWVLESASPEYANLYPSHLSMLLLAHKKLSCLPPSVTSVALVLATTFPAEDRPVAPRRYIDSLTMYAWHHLFLLNTAELLKIYSTVTVFNPFNFWVRSSTFLHSLTSSTLLIYKVFKVC